MSTYRWQEIEPLLAEALDLPAERRRAHLERRAGGDETLLAELIAYLELEDEADELFERPIVDLIAGRSPEYRAGERIGPFLLDGEIARGGMGVVYRAHRVEGGFEQEVAIKVLKRGFDTGDFVRRFRTEQQILADLDHPNIVRLLDGGATEDGLPYLVMEAVEGTRLDRYRGERPRSKEELLALFLKICDAVHVAHQHMVVHCDLKPSNILVTAAGEPKLLDFGIAKVLRQGTEGATQSLGLRLGSPPYCSPEQSAGDGVTSGNDVYSLGQLLVLLLTGERPPPHPGPDALPLPPSRIADRQQRGEAPPAGPALEASELRGDLDAIALRALAWNPEERYASAAALADDVRRHLDGLPVSAQPYTWTYALSRFARRRRRELAAAAVFGLLLLASAAVALTLQVQARVEATRAEGMRDAYLEMLEAYDATSAESDAEATRTAVEALLAGPGFDDPADQALLFDRVGRTLYRLGAHAEAEEILSRAVELREALDPPRPLELAESLNNLALVYKARGDLERALELYERARGLQRRARETPRATLEGLDLEANLAAALLQRGEPEQAEALYRETLAGYRALGADDSVDYAKTLAGYGLLHFRAGRFEPAEDLLREALALRRRLQGDDHLQLANPLLSLATVLDARGADDEAIELYREAYAIRRSGSGETRADTARVASALAYALLGRGRAGDLEEAEAALDTALPALRADPGHGPDHDQTLRAQSRLAALHLARGRPARAEALLRDLLARAPRAWTGAQAWRHAEAESLLGAALLAQGESTAARPLLEASAAELAETRGEGSRPAREARERWRAWVGR